MNAIRRGGTILKDALIGFLAGLLLLILFGLAMAGVFFSNASCTGGL